MIIELKIENFRSIKKEVVFSMIATKDKALPEPNTKWSVGCQRGIADFCEKRTKEEYAKWRRRS